VEGLLTLSRSQIVIRLQVFLISKSAPERILFETKLKQPSMSLVLGLPNQKQPRLFVPSARFKAVVTSCKDNQDERFGKHKKHLDIFANRSIDDAFERTVSW
jgi:hypothetical protein